MCKSKRESDFTCSPTATNPYHMDGKLLTDRQQHPLLLLLILFLLLVLTRRRCLASAVGVVISASSFVVACQQTVRLIFTEISTGVVITLSGLRYVNAADNRIEKYGNGWRKHSAIINSSANGSAVL